jgi:hypothetical protein
VSGGEIGGGGLGDREVRRGDRGKGGGGSTRISIKWMAERSLRLGPDGVILEQACSSCMRTSGEISSGAGWCTPASVPWLLFFLAELFWAELGTVDDVVTCVLVLSLYGRRRNR